MNEAKSTENSNGLHVIGLKIDRFMRIEAADLTGLPDNGVVIVAGDNGQGKTTTLRAIWCALAGAKEIPEWPINGENPKGSIELSLGRLGMPEYKIVRKFTRKGTALELCGAEGKPIERPQEVLNEMIGRLSFNPLAFRAMHPQSQRDILLVITGLAAPLADLDTRRAELFGDRALVGRDAKNKRGEIENLIMPPEPTEPVDTAKLIAEKNRRIEERQANDQQRQYLQDAIADVHRIRERKESLESQIEKLRADLGDVADELDERLHALEARTEHTNALVDPETESIDQAIRDAGAANMRHAEAIRYREALALAENYERVYASLSDQIESIDVAKENLLTEAEFPVPGLGFREDGVTFNGLPFEQLAGAEQIRISVAVAMRLNPDIKVILIDDASLLDEEHFGIVREMALEKGYQIWCAVVGNRDGAAVVFEQGVAVRGSAVAP